MPETPSKTRANLSEASNEPHHLMQIDAHSDVWAFDQANKKLPSVAVPDTKGVFPA